MAKSSTAVMSDAAVQAKTGKTWPEWFAVLDAAGCKKMTHQQIVAVLHTEHGLGPWWQQMVTVGYERARGLREKHQRPGGHYSASVSRTVAAPLPALYTAWQDRKKRRRWLPDEFTVRKANENKSLRITWADGETSVEVNFYPKGDTRSQVAVEHNKLADAQAVARMKVFWSEALDKLKAILES